MTRTPINSEPDKQPLARRVVSWAVRGVVAGFLAWLCVWSLQGISAFARPAPTSEPAPKPAFSPLTLAQHDLTGGAWQFLDDAGNVSAEVVTAADSQQRILTPPVVPEVPAHDLSGQFSDVLQIMREQGELKQVGDLWRLSFKQLGFHVVAFTRDRAAHRLLTIRWLIPLDTGKFWLVEQTPARRTNATHVTQVKTDQTNTPTAGLRSSSEMLIPHHIPSQLLAERLDNNRRAICQLLRVESALPDLLEQLRQEGWQIELPANQIRTGFATISLSRQSESYWIVASPISDSTALRILLLKDGESPAASSEPP